MQPTLNVVITGASAGLGRAIAHEFGKAGARETTVICRSFEPDGA